MVFAKKTPENNNKGVVDKSSEKPRSRSDGALQFIDNRPEAATQRTLQAMADNSPHVQQATQFEAVQKKPNKSGLPMGTPVMQCYLRQDLLGKTKKLGLVGERHDEINEENEKAVWKNAGIKLFYEEEKIPTRPSEPPVRPDPLKYKILHEWKLLNAIADAIIKNQSGFYLTEDPNDKEGGIYNIRLYTTALWKDLDSYKGEVERTELREKIKRAKKECSKLLGWTRISVLTSSSFYIPEFQRLIRQVNKKIKDLRLALDVPDTSFKEYSRVRSRHMIVNANTIASRREKVIYKVGNRHIKDIAANKGAEGWEISDSVKLVDRSHYIKEDYLEAANFWYITATVKNLVATAKGLNTTKHGQTLPRLEKARGEVITRLRMFLADVEFPGVAGATITSLCFYLSREVRDDDPSSWKDFKEKIERLHDFLDTHWGHS